MPVFKDRRQFGNRRVARDRRIEEAPARAERRASDERRQLEDRRRRTLLSAKVIYNDRQSTLSCTVRDLSVGGAKLIFGVMPTCPNTFELDLGEGRVHLCEVAYREADTIGVHFLDAEVESGADS